MGREDNPMEKTHKTESVMSTRGFRILVATGVLGIVGLTVSNRSNQQSTQLFSASNTVPSVEFHVGNSATSIEQNKVKMSKKIAVDYPWRYIIEPHRETVFLASDNFCDSCTDESYEWSIDGNTLTGRQVTFTSSEVKAMDVVLSVTDPSGVIIQKTQTVMSKYVRRELRSLSESDREVVFDSMHAMYAHTTEEGLAKGFGAKFKDIASFVSKHLDGSAQKECDQWHDGAAFYATHIAFTLEFEQSMQAVSPVVAMPYWDFTKDQYYQDTDGTDWRTSHIFGAKWFGHVSSKQSDHAIDTGKWAFTEVKNVGKDSPLIHNPFGLLRSPWNVNQSPYITRSEFVDSYKSFGGELPSCQAYMECFLSDTMAVMTECLNGQAHGQVHVLIGGIWNKDITNSLIEESNAYNLLLMSKNLWRQGYVSCPSKCTSTDPTKICSCSYNQAGAGDITAYDVLANTGLFNWIAQYSNLVYLDSTGVFRIKGLEASNQETEAWETFLKTTLSDLGSVGEMFSSASPYDPTFWIIHGTADRLVHWRRLLAHSEYVDMPLDETWGYAHNSQAASDSHLVCDWSAVDAGEAAMPTCASGECPGSNSGDMSPFSGFVEGDEETGYTNTELYAFLSPLNTDLPYVYDNFEWSHCDSQGYNFGVQSSGTVLTDYALPKKHKSTA